MKIKKFLATFLFIVLVVAASSPPAFGINVPNEYSGSNASLACSGSWLKVICVIKKISDIIHTIQDIATTITNWIPHSFPFGGPILTSERACSIKFSEYTRIPNPGCLIPGVCAFMPPTIIVGPAHISWGLAGRGIEVGPPLPSNGKVIAFPWISQIYDQHTENRVGPWALGLGFTPFPLIELNSSLKNIVITLAPLPLPLDCSKIALLSLSNYTAGPVSQVYLCIDNIHFDCLASGEKDNTGADVFKVIRLLGTSGENVPLETMNQLKNAYKAFNWLKFGL